MPRSQPASDLTTLINRLAAESAAEGLGLDVAAIVEGARQSERLLRGTPKAIRSLSGLIVSRYREGRDQVLRRRAARQQESRLRAEAIARRHLAFADLWIEVLQATSQGRLRPPELAYLLSYLREHGYPEFNEHLIARLHALGSDWPADPLEPRIPVAGPGREQV